MLSPLCTVFTWNKPCFYGKQCCSCSVSTVCAICNVISPVQYVLYCYISTSCSMCAVPNMAVFCISLITWSPSMLLGYYLSDFEMVPVAPIIAGITLLLLLLLLTYSMVQSPSWEANWFAASQEIPRISRNPKVHYRTHKRPPTISILGQPNPVHIPTFYLLEIHPNIIHPSTPRSPQLLFPSGFPTKTLYAPLSSLIRATCPAHLILLDFITRTILGEEYRWFIIIIIICYSF